MLVPVCFGTKAALENEGQAEGRASGDGRCRWEMKLRHRIPMLSPFGLAAANEMALETDRNNLDSARPLRFHDVYSIAFGDRILASDQLVNTHTRNQDQMSLKESMLAVCLV